MNPVLVLGDRIIHSAHGEYTIWLEPWNLFIQILNPMLRGNSFFVPKYSLVKLNIHPKEFCIRKLKNLVQIRQLIPYET